MQEWSQTEFDQSGFLCKFHESDFDKFSVEVWDCLYPLEANRFVSPKGPTLLEITFKFMTGT